MYPPPTTQYQRIVAFIAAHMSMCVFLFNEFFYFVDICILFIFFNFWTVFTYIVFSGQYVYIFRKTCSFFTTLWTYFAKTCFTRNSLKIPKPEICGICECANCHLPANIHFLAALVQKGSYKRFLA